MHDVLTIGVPTLAVLLGILLNRYDYGRLDTKLESRLSAFENRMEARLSSGESRMESRLSGVENRLHSDVMLFVGKVENLERRVTQVENR